MRISRWIFVTVLAGTSCAHQPFTYVFISTKVADADTVALLADTLEKQGHRVATVDRQKREIVTYWEDTKYRDHEADDFEDETAVYLRYRIQVRSSDGQVSVTSEAQRCVPYRAVITRTEVRSECEKMTYLFGPQQPATERLGSRLAASLGGTG
jgi:hypothetical protein